MSQFFQISENEWKEVANPYEIACLNVAAEYFVTQFGITFIEFYDDGLGPAKAFVIQVGDAQFWLMSHFDEPMFGVSTLSYEPNPRVALEAMLSAFGLSADDLSWVREGLGDPKWVLYRVDDNGNEIEMYRFHEEHAAQGLKRIYEKKGHKQAYIVTQNT